MIGETNLYIENIEEILNRENTGSITKRIELEILAGEFCAISPSESDDNFLKFIARYSSAVEIIEQQINN